MRCFPSAAPRARSRTPPTPTTRHIALSCTRRCTPAGVHATHAAGNRVSTAAESSVFVFREGVSATRESVSGFCATEVSVARSRGPRSGSCHTTTGNAAPGCGSSACTAATASSVAADPPPTPRPDARRASTPSRLRNKISSAPSTTLSDRLGSDSSRTDSAPIEPGASSGEPAARETARLVRESSLEKAAFLSSSASAAGANESARRPFSNRFRTATSASPLPRARRNAAGWVSSPSAKSESSPPRVALCAPLATAAGTESTAKADASPSAAASFSAFSGSSPTYTSTNAGWDETEAADASADPASAVRKASSSSRSSASSSSSTSSSSSSSSWPANLDAPRSRRGTGAEDADDAEGASRASSRAGSSSAHGTHDPVPTSTHAPVGTNRPDAPFSSPSPRVVTRLVCLAQTVSRGRKFSRRTFAAAALAAPSPPRSTTRRHPSPASSTVARSTAAAGEKDTSTSPPRSTG